MGMFEGLLTLPLWLATLAISVVCYGLYLVWFAYYRLFLSPIAKFPGPKLAALTFWYEGYYDVVKTGQYLFEIEKMHHRYGPIVRVNPEELHINDPDFYENVYAGSHRPRDKWAFSAQAFGNPTSFFATVEHDLHRSRRAALSASFSRQAITRLEPMIHEAVEKMCVRIREWQQSQKPLFIRHAYAALALDVVTEYCFAQSLNALDDPNFDIAWLTAMDNILVAGNFMKHVRWVLKLMEALPDWLVLRLSPLMSGVIKLRQDLVKIAKRVKNTDFKEMGASNDTVFHRIVQSDLPPEEKSLERLSHEGQVMVAAGQLTTADTLEHTTFHLLSNPDALQKLKSELETAMPNSYELISWQKLEQLPYLDAVICEGLRITCPLVGRLSRVPTEEDLVFNNWTIPRGTPVSMSAFFLHYRNDDHFPEPDKFKPERWLLPPAERHQLEKYLVPFSKGSRACLGMNLAKAELYLTLAAVFRRFDMELFETTYEDIRIMIDETVSMPRPGSERLKVLIKK